MKLKTMAILTTGCAKSEEEEGQAALAKGASPEAAVVEEV
jgi:hypothetical protein